MTTKGIESTPSPYRMRIVADDDAVNPRRDSDQTANVITVDRSRYIDIDEDSGPLSDQWADLRSRHDADDAMRIFERYARMMHGACVLPEYPSSDGSRAIWYVMPDALNLAYAPDGREAYGMRVLEAERAEYRAWASGEAVGYVIEQRTLWTSEDLDDTKTTWEEVESCWGFFDLEYAQGEGQRALDALNLAKVLKDKPEKVTTWADSFGVWHARVTFAGDGYGPAALAAEIDRVRRRARRAIRSQITLREKVGTGWRCALVVAETVLDSMNVARSIEFMEKTKD